MADRFDKFTERARKVLQLAQEESQGFNHNYIGTEHLLLGLLREGEGVAARVLASLRIDVGKVRDDVELLIGRGDRMVAGDIGLTPRAKKTIELAVEEALRLGHHYVGTEHILLGLVREGEGIATSILEVRGVTLDALRKRVLEVINSPTYGSGAGHGATTEDRFDKFTRRARRALQFAQEEALRLGRQGIGAEHIFLGLLRDRTSVATRVLVHLGQNPDQLAETIAGGSGQVPASSAIGLLDSARKTIELAVEEARALDHRYIGTEHLLVGVMREGANAAATALQAREITVEKVRAAIATVLSSQPPRLPHSISAELPPAELEAVLSARLSDEARRVLAAAQEEANQFNHNYVGTEHILLGLVREPTTGAGHVLTALGLELDKVRRAVEFIIGRGERTIQGDPGYTPRARKVMSLALDEAERLDQSMIASEHLLLGLVREGEGIAAGVLESLGVSMTKVRRQVLESLGQPPEPPVLGRVSRGLRKALLQAQLVARWYYQPRVDTEHLLVGLARERNSVAARALRDLGVELQTLLTAFEALWTEPPTAKAPADRVDYSPAAQAAIDRATVEAAERGHANVGTGHLLLAVVALPDSHARTLLQRLNVSPDTIQPKIEPLLAENDDT